MRLILSLLALSVSVQAGAIKGVVLEHASGRPLARTIVRLNPVPRPGGVTGQPLVMRAGKAGQFEFGPLSPGIYLLRAVRDGYFVTTYSQRVPTGRGVPIEVTDTSTLSEALTHTVGPDLETKDADINPQLGPLFRLGGLLLCDTPGPVIVTLSSETGRQTTESGCAGGYRFEGLASGDYEVGLLGIAFGFFLSWLIAHVAEWKTIVTPLSVMVAFGVSVGHWNSVWPLSGCESSTNRPN